MSTAIYLGAKQRPTDRAPFRQDIADRACMSRPEIGYFTQQHIRRLNIEQPGDMTERLQLFNDLAIEIMNARYDEELRIDAMSNDVEQCQWIAALFRRNP